eukprot:TRINITY_DN11323_c0_g1_i6.p1 TRINITY_DN11323_c0_g1~~TRINITY_DN11323_c0_g1_i6.p1  ORF type:complete len:625 (+),score=141.77 TRINITY_DN11323_c0_g1_i6:972-2846(+)
MADVPGTIAEPTTASEKKNDAGYEGTTTGSVLVDKATDFTERAIKAMHGGLIKLDAKVDDKSSMKKCTKTCVEFQDPVQTARCSTGRLTFFCLFAWGVSFIIIEYLYYDSWVEMASAAFLAALALFVTIFLGGDLFMFEAFKGVVNAMEKQVNRLRESLNFLEDKRKELGVIADGIEEVHKQMGGDIHATTQLLCDMEKLGKLQTVAAVVNQFYAADYDGSGHINGAEAELLLPQITMLWDLVPGFDRSKLEGYIKANGMTLDQLSCVLDALVEEDETKCTKALQVLCSGVVDTEAGKPSEPAVADAPAHSAAPPRVVGMLAWDADLEAPPHTETSLKFLQESKHSMPPPETVAPSSSADGSGKCDKEEDVMKPLFTVPTPLPTKQCGPISVGGKCSVWGCWHLGFLICSFVSIICFVLVLVQGEIHHIILATVSMCLAMGLTGTGKLVEILRHLRRQAKEFKAENEHLDSLNQGIADEVAKLQKLKCGFDKLQQLCAGNVQKAKELLKKSDTKIRMEAMAVVTHLFKHADADNNMELNAEEKNMFLQQLTHVFRQVPGFDQTITTVKSIVESDGMGHKHIKDIVDVVASLGTSSTAGSSAASSSAAPVASPVSSDAAAEGEPA